MALPELQQRPGNQGHLPLRLLGAIGLLVAGCTKDPIYIAPDPPLMQMGPVAEGEVAPLLTIAVPIAVETADDTDEREKLAIELGLTLEQVPTARRDDYELEIEWALTNLEDRAGQAVFAINGANELWRYDPTVFVEDPEEDEPPPSLLGGKLVDLPASGSVTGVFREDELYEASQDLDAITRGGVVPGFALLTRWPDGSVTGGTGGELAAIPSKAVPLVLQLDVGLETDVQVELSYRLRVRERSDRLRPPGTDGADGALVAASTAVFLPPMMPTP